MKLSQRILFFANLIKAKATGKNMPLAVVLNTTNQCNFRCIYCYGPYYDNPKTNFTTEQLKGLIDELAEMGTKSITLGGGEPLMRQDIGEIIDYIKAKNIECGMNTNGVLIPAKIEAVKKLDLVCVSLDGGQQANDANRGRGTYDRIMAGIRMAQKAGLIVHTNTVLTKNNLGAVDEFMEWLKKNNIHGEFNLPFYQTSVNKDQPALNLSNEECQQVIKKVISYKEKGYPVLFSDKVHQYVANWPNYKKKMYIGEKPNFKYIKCQAGRYMCFIDADGQVYPCAQMIGTFKALNFKKAGFKKAWEHLAQHDCRACYFVCFNELNSIFNLDLSVIFSNVIMSLKEVFKKEK